ncbi:MAG: ABC transporter permease subunit [Salipiger thiooxidans]
MQAASRGGSHGSNLNGNYALSRVSSGWKSTPDDFTIFISSIILAIMILGGKGTFFGPIVGAFILTIIPESLGEFSRYKMLFFGVLLILTITFLPGGIMQLVRNARTRRA